MKRRDSCPAKEGLSTIFLYLYSLLFVGRWKSILTFTFITVAASVILQNIFCATIKQWGLDKVKSQ